MTNKNKIKIKPLKRINRLLIMSAATMFIIVILFVLLIPEQDSLKKLVPDDKGALFVEIENDLVQSEQLKTELSAEKTLVVTYGINGLKNSKVKLELLEYLPENFPQYLENHLSGETIFVGGTEIDLPCNNIYLDGTNVKTCKYESESFSVVKQTFPVEPNIVARILCTELSVVSAEIHCRQIATGVIKNSR